MNEFERLKEFIGRVVVIDTDSELLYVGTLVSADGGLYELSDVDVHDSRTTSTTRDLYIINVAKLGVKKNRDRVRVRTARVVSFSVLEEITRY